MRIGISATPVYNIKKEVKNIDGIGTYTANLCQALTRQDVQVKEIYFKKPNEIAINNHSKEKNFYLTNNPFFSLLPGNYYKNITPEIDLIHITDYLVPHIKNIPTISFIHDAIMLVNPEWRTGSESFNRLKGYLLKKVAHRADHIITCSQANIADIVNLWKIPEYKISVIYHGLLPIWHLRIAPEKQETIQKKYRLNKPFFLIVGTIQARKNHERIINAYLSMPKKITANFTLVLAGKERSTLTPPSLVEKILRLEKAGSLYWLKYVPFDDLRCLYQSAYAVLYPSLAEGFGFPVLEGFASGTPVITSLGGATAEIAGGAAYLVDPYSETAIATAMLELINNPAARTQLIQQGLSRVRQFTWDKCAQQTIEVYKKFL